MKEKNQMDVAQAAEGASSQAAACKVAAPPYQAGSCWSSVLPAARTYRTNENGTLPDSPPLQQDTGKGQVPIVASYANMVICVRRRSRMTEIVIDGWVYDRVNGTLDMNRPLTARKNGVVFQLSVIPGYRAQMYLHADGRLIGQAPCSYTLPK